MRKKYFTPALLLSLAFTLSGCQTAASQNADTASQSDASLEAASSEVVSKKQEVAPMESAYQTDIALPTEAREIPDYVFWNASALGPLVDEETKEDIPATFESRAKLGYRWDWALRDTSGTIVCGEASPEYLADSGSNEPGERAYIFSKRTKSNTEKEPFKKAIPESRTIGYYSMVFWKDSNWELFGQNPEFFSSDYRTKATVLPPGYKTSHNGFTYYATNLGIYIVNEETGKWIFLSPVESYLHNEA